MRMVRFGGMLKRLAASCCSFDVVYGAGAFRDALRFVIALTE